MKKHIFTIMAGCVPVGAKMLESYFNFHHKNIHIYLFGEDSIKLRANFHPESFIVHVLPESLKDSFSRGHEGTAKVWAQVIKENPDSYLIQIDSDIIFKKETLSLIEKAGYPDLYGSRRCYKNNPADIPVADGIEDALSTYFIGLNPYYLKDIAHGDLERMCQGVYNPLGFPVFDFFDPVFFYIRAYTLSTRIGLTHEFNHKKPTVYYEDPDKIGGQNAQGNKNNSYISNLHLDMGSHLCHFGGAGSGYAACVDDSKMNKSYSDWAKFRWFLFEDLFYPKALRLGVSKIMYDYFPEETIIKEDGRWVSGNYNEEIFNQIKEDLNN